MFEFGPAVLKEAVILYPSLSCCCAVPWGLGEVVLATPSRAPPRSAYTAAADIAHQPWQYQKTVSYH